MQTYYVFFRRKLSFEAVTLNELKEIIVLDSSLQNALKQEIDDLVFCLYFNEQPETLSQNTFYQYLSTTQSP